MRQRKNLPREARPEWVKPSDAEIEAAGGYFDEDGWWVSFVMTRAQAGKRNVLKARAALTPEIRRANMAVCNAAQTPEMRKASVAAMNAAITPEMRRTMAIRALTFANAKNSTLTLEQRQATGRKTGGLHEGLKNRGKLTTRNTSGQVGVSWNKQTQTWRVYLGRKYIGPFETYEEALAARKAAELKYWRD